MTGIDNEKDTVPLDSQSLGLIPKADEALPENEVLGKLLFEMTAQGVVCLDATGVIAANPAACRMLGLTAGQMRDCPTGKPRWRAVHDDGSDFPWDEQPGMLALRTGSEVLDVVVGVANPEDSGFRWFNANAKPLFRAGESTAFRTLVFLDDITEHKRTENTLRESEEKYRRLVQSTSDLIFSADPDGTYRFVNEAYAGPLNLTPAEIIGKTPNDLFAPAEAEKRLMFLRRVFDSGEKGYAEVKYVTRAGEERYSHSTLEPFYDEQGKPSWALGIVHDITDRKRAEESLRNEQLFSRSVVESLPGFFYLCTYPELRLVLWNRQYETLLGYEAAELKGRHVAEGLAPEVKEAKLDLISKVMQTGQASMETFVTTKSGGSIPCLLTAVRFEAKSQSYFMGTGIDITERKKAEQEKTKLETQLQQARKMEAVGRLAGGVAHDFNNMLCAILGHVEMAMEEADPAQPIYADLEEIQQAARRSADLTSQLLAFARKQTVVPRVFDLNQTVDAMLKTLRRLISENIDLIWRPNAKLWLVKLDPSQIDQILANLCVNARDAIDATGKITIETGNSQFDQDYCDHHAGYVIGNYVQLAVSDNGCGMDKETLARLFEPFFTRKGLGKGTGLGLSTVYGIVEQNRGFIIVDSEPEHGTTFKIYLPRHEGDVRLAVESASRSPTRGSEILLVVEDEPSILKMTRRMLERQGYTVFAAHTPGEAIRLATEHLGEIHLLVTDVVMPEMNGKDLAERLLSLYPRLKRLFMSGYTADVIAHHGVLDEDVDFIQKPFSKEDLAAKVREVLEGRHKAGS